MPHDSSVLLEVGRSYSLSELDANSGAPPEIVCTGLEQRNWSRVGIGVTPDRRRRYFLKQSVDRRGGWHERLWRFEHEGTRVAEPLLAGIATVPSVVHADRRHLLNVFEYAQVETPDQLLRRDPARFGEKYPFALDRMVAVIHALTDPSAELACEVTAKQRDYGGPPTAVCFKGFEIRNCGFAAEDEALVLFDFGRPYRAPTEELAAKLLVSVGLLNWGRPIARFLRGPDLEILEHARSRLESLLDPGAVRAELALQREFRTNEIKSGGRWGGFLKGVGVQTIGKKYLGQLESWCARSVG